MSLSVYLNVSISHETETKIFIRRNGSTVEITRTEWDVIYPDREPIVTSPVESNQVFWGNITHNLGPMADAAGIYKILWRPDEAEISTAKQLIGPFTEGLKRLAENKEELLKFNPSNGWGDYDGLLSFVKRYLAACEEFPTASVSVSR